jgi:D-glycero-D-manno-heptose 1,7-bisphosphate phosphatase
MSHFSQNGSRFAMTGRRAVFLDRDGVLVRTHVVSGKPAAITPADEVLLCEGAAQACAELARAGFALVMVTNQPDIKRGRTTLAFVEATNRALAATLALDDVRVCYHDDADGCACRKPAPGLLLAAGAALEIDLARSVMVGDRWRDIAAGARAGCRTVLVGTGYDDPFPLLPDLRVDALRDAVDWIRDPCSLLRSDD